mgnify:CR=1 FL=1
MVEPEEVSDKQEEEQNKQEHVDKEEKRQEHNQTSWKILIWIKT